MVLALAFPLKEGRLRQIGLELSAEDEARPPAEWKGVYDTFTRAFNTTAIPAAETLAGLTAAELEQLT
jgi:hypothetical protein